MKSYAVILASGSGERFGSAKTPKHLAPIDDVPAVIWTISAAIQSGLFEKVAIVVRKQDVRITQDAIKLFFGDDLQTVYIVEGANERIYSFINGLNILCEATQLRNDDIVALLDANRPLIQVSQLIALKDAALQHGCACPARGVVNGVARISGEHIISVPEKKDFVEFVTPEFIQFKLLNKALERKGSSFACMVEYALSQNVAPFVLEASSLNAKLTFPEDVSYLEGLTKKFALKTQLNIGKIHI